MFVKQKKADCCGCSACYAICPAKAIVMAPDEEGFLYPQIDEQNCLHCDLCHNVCPLTSEKRVEAAMQNTDFQQCYYGGRAADEQIVHRSRSGGMIYLLAESILRQGGIVYGTALDSNFNAVLTRAKTPAQLTPMQGSKYVQADMVDGFATIKHDLATGRKPVLFAGTACETAGLLAYLRRSGCDTKALYTVDFVCHGVPSPKIWQDNLQELTKKWHLTLTEVNFRDKQLGWRSHIESYCGIRKNGKTSARKYSNKYTTVFYSGVILRPSCYDCRFCSFDRPADLTVGDFWGAATAGLQGKAANGLSQIIVNTEKGAALLQTLGGTAELYIATKEAVSKQPNLFHPTARPTEREKFWQLYWKKGYITAADAFYPLIERIKIPYNLLKSEMKNVRRQR